MLVAARTRFRFTADQEFTHFLEFRDLSIDG